MHCDTTFKCTFRHHFSNSNHSSPGVLLQQPVLVYFSVFQELPPELSLFIDTRLAHTKLDAEAGSVRGANESAFHFSICQS